MSTCILLAAAACAARSLARSLIILNICNTMAFHSSHCHRTKHLISFTEPPHTRTTHGSTSPLHISHIFEINSVHVCYVLKMNTFMLHICWVDLDGCVWDQ